MRIRKLTPNRLSLSLHLALLASLPSIANAQQLIALTGQAKTATGTYADGTTNGFTLAAEGTGASITGSATVRNTGRNGAALFSNLAGDISLANSTISASGADGTGVWAQDGGTVNLTDSTVDATGPRGSGVFAWDGTVDMNGGSVTVSFSVLGASAIHARGTGIVTSSNQTVTTAGMGTAAVLASEGGHVTLNNSNASVDGADSYGAYATGAGSTIETTDAEIAVTGPASHGVVADAGGTVALVDSTVISSVIAGNHALLSMGTGSLITASGTDINSSGSSARGAGAQSGAAIRIENGSSITTTGLGSLGATALGTGSTLTLDASTVDTSGLDAIGAAAADGAQVSVINGATVSTTGLGAYGVVATGLNSLLTVDGSVVHTSGSQAPGAVAQAGALVSLTNGATVEASGNSSNALEVTGTGSRATSNASTITSTQAVGVVMSQGVSVDLVDTTVKGLPHAVGFVAVGTDPAITTPAILTVSGGSLFSEGALLQSQDIHAQVTLADDVSALTTSGELARAKDGSVLLLTLRNTAVQGDVIAESGSALDLTIDAQGALEGAAYNGRQLSMLGDSLWTVTNSSTFASATNVGQIAFAAPTGGNFKTLTISGDYTGNGGTVVLNTALGNDASRTDTLIVQGNTSGTTALRVNNAGGAGAYTTADGIQVVRVDGASNGSFALDGRVVAGANEYLLAQGGKANPADGDWYLRSEAPPPPAPEPPPADPTPVEPAPVPTAPVIPTVPEPAGLPVYRPEPAAYLANQAASVGMFEHSMHDRMGEPNLGKRGDDGRSEAAWVRVVRNQMDGQTGAGQLDAGTDLSVLQIGGEIARWNGDGRFHLGLMGGTGRAHTQVASNLTDWHAKGNVTGYNLGVYGTWFANATNATGVYLDGWLQYGRYDNRVQGERLSEERYDAHTLSASIEAGYAFALNDGGNTRLFIEPQAQAIFTDYSASKHREDNGTLIDDRNAGGLTTRLGVRFYGHAATTAHNLVQPFVTVNWWHDNDRNVMSFNDTALALGLPRDRYELKLGAQGQLGGGWTGWGNLGLAAGAGDYRDVTGQLGLNYRW
ncbi:autotransporter outer membrane beta-barrel domain-containing protein [Lysobacter sp. LF1]|uniref:Autotransporter outer membrane beta-barrel domain-containing protein n=1 Tax=Lysobacter stagni TaxID=3045172 RepID=A0ABT6XK29_9GAMM|nr:autotransporter outer membrane beta-barrel domain-containing protein [Lysobacter sp. LF1]MDI9240517.1 autotransporter outer membrane beta-barrel domain-containing protein [Lysobacter sp. LF1]